MIFLRNILILIIALLISVSLANAATFDVTVAPITKRITIDEFAKFQITIKNNLRDQADEYRISNLNFPTWDVRTDPIANPITLPVPSQLSASIEIVVDPL